MKKVALVGLPWLSTKVSSYREALYYSQHKNNMPKIVSKGHKTWKDGSVMNYTITDDGVLTISGTLPLEDYVDIRSKAPFRHLVIEDGIKYIGRKNFAYWEEIEELTLPPSVKILRIRAFEKCTNLKRVHFSEGLETIGKVLFDGLDLFDGIEGVEDDIQQMTAFTKDTESFNLEDYYTDNGAFEDDEIDRFRTALERLMTVKEFLDFLKI